MPLPEHLKKALENKTYQGEELTICSWGLDNADIAKLVNLLADNPHITSLNLRRNNISDAGAKLLAKLSTLKRINLALNHIYDEGAIALSKMENLEFLDLADNGLTDEGALAIIKGSKCQSFVLEENVEVSRYLQRIKKPDSEIEQKMTIYYQSTSIEEQRSIEDMLSRLKRTANHPGLDMFADVVVEVCKEATPIPKG